MERRKKGKRSHQIPFANKELEKRISRTYKPPDQREEKKSLVAREFFFRGWGEKGITIGEESRLCI